jgi:hypothetical protein
VSTKATYEIIINLFLKDPSTCHKGKEYRLAKCMLKLVPDLKFWESIKAEPVFSLTYFLTKENKARFLHEYEHFKIMAKFDLDKMKETKYSLADDKVGEDSAKRSNKKLNLLEFIKHGAKKEN